MLPFTYTVFYVCFPLVYRTSDSLAHSLGISLFVSLYSWDLNLVIGATSILHLAGAAILFMSSAKS